MVTVIYIWHLQIDDLTFDNRKFEGHLPATTNEDKCNHFSWFLIVLYSESTEINIQFNPMKQSQISSEMRQIILSHHNTAH